MEKLSETELFLLKVNACYEPELSVEGTKKAIQIIEEQKHKIDKAIEYIQKRFEINEYGEYYFTHTFDNSNMKELLEILGGKNE